MHAVVQNPQGDIAAGIATPQQAFQPMLSLQHGTQPYLPAGPPPPRPSKRASSERKIPLQQPASAENDFKSQQVQNQNQNPELVQLLKNNPTSMMGMPNHFQVQQQQRLQHHQHQQMDLMTNSVPMCLTTTATNDAATIPRRGVVNPASLDSSIPTDLSASSSNKPLFRLPPSPMSAASNSGPIIQQGAGLAAPSVASGQDPEMLRLQHQHSLLDSEQQQLKSKAIERTKKQFILEQEQKMQEHKQKEFNIEQGGLAVLSAAATSGQDPEMLRLQHQHSLLDSEQQQLKSKAIDRTTKHFILEQEQKMLEHKQKHSNIEQGGLAVLSAAATSGQDPEMLRLQHQQSLLDSEQQQLKSKAIEQTKQQFILEQEQKMLEHKRKEVEEMRKREERELELREQQLRQKRKQFQAELAEKQRIERKIQEQRQQLLVAQQMAAMKKQAAAERAAAMAAATAKRQQHQAVKRSIPPPKPSEAQQRSLLEALHLQDYPFRSPSIASAGSSLNSPASPMVSGSPRPRAMLPRGGLPPPSPQSDAGSGTAKKGADAASKKGFTIQSGFDTLRSLIPSLNTGDPQNDSCKISKAALLTKGGDYLKELKTAKAQNALEIKERKESIAKLQGELKSLQSELPYGGKEAKRRRNKNSNSFESASQDTTDMFAEHARVCAVQTNWKYWVFSELVKPLAESFDRTLGHVNFEHTASNVSVWLDQCCGLPQLRQLMTEQLRKISVSTDILLEPDNFAHETVSRAANVSNGQQRLPQPVRNNSNISSDFDDSVKAETDHDG